MGGSYKQGVVTKMLSYIEQHKEDIGSADYSEMTAFLMSQFSKEMPLFKVTYAKLKPVGSTFRHIRKTKLVCTVENSSEIVVPAESECMHGIRFAASGDGRTIVQFDEDDPCKTHHTRTLIHMQRMPDTT
jgi:hypothetical protein